MAGKRPEVAAPAHDGRAARPNIVVLYSDICATGHGIAYSATEVMNFSGLFCSPVLCLKAAREESVVQDAFAANVARIRVLSGYRVLA
jgi:hypothetical protein